MISRTSRVSIGLLLLAVLAAIAWYSYWTLPRGSLIPGFVRFAVLFGSGLALPYAVAMGLLLRGNGRDGVHMAFGASLVNAIWIFPLGTVFALFAGFTMGNRDQEQVLLAILSGMLLHIPLLILSGAALWNSRKAATPGGRKWALALAFPILASGLSWGYLEWHMNAAAAQSSRAQANSLTVQQTMSLLQDCLATYRETGYPSTLDACSDVAGRLPVSSGYAYDYVPSLADAAGRVWSYQVCARPIEFRATGFETLVGDRAGIYGQGMATQATLEKPPTCVSILPVERALVWCAHLQAVRGSSSGYPKRLSEMADCIGTHGQVAALASDRLTMQNGEVFAYVSGAPDASGRVSTFRVYRLRRTDGLSVWIDEQLQESEKKGPHAGPVIEGLPEVAAPEQFESGCQASRGEDCYVAGSEWVRRAVQTNLPRLDPTLAPMFDAARKAYARGCELRHARSCVELASEFESSQLIPRDIVRATALYEQACTWGEALGCRYGGEMFERGRKAKTQSLQPQLPPVPPGLDVPKDTPHAVELFSRACTLGDEDACFIAGRILADGEGMPADPPRALGFFAPLCANGFAQACVRAADLSVDARQDYLRRACILDEATPCT
ncbi:MAG: tetratricopeptide repeat protein [Nitrospira sp.]